MAWHIRFAALGLILSGGIAACEVPLSQWQLTHYTSDDGLPLDSLYSAVQDDTGFLWIGSEDGLARFDGRDFERIPFSSAIDYASEYVESLLLDSGQRILIGTSGDGIVRIGTTPPFQHEQVLDGSFRVNDMVHADDGLVLAATHRSGVLIVDTNTGEFLEPLAGRAASTVSSLSPRSSGGWWIGYGGQGVQWFDGERFHDLADSEVLSELHVNDVIESDDQVLWIAARDGLYSVSSGRVEKHDGKAGLPDDPFVRSLMIDRGGQLWIGLDNGGIARLCAGQFEYLAGARGLSPAPVTSLIQDTEGGVWISTGGSGLIQMSQGMARPLTEQHGLPDFPVLPIAQGADGEMWFGTFGGGVARRMEDGRIEIIGTAEGLVANQVLSLLPDGDRIWVGTRNGLSLIEDGQVTRNWTEADGLPHPTVGSMAKDGERLWLGTVEALGELTDEGIRRWEPEGGFGGYIVGLLVDREGTLWIATDGGGMFMRRGERIVPAPFADQLPSRTVTSLYESDTGLLWATTANGLLRWDGTRATVIRPQQGLPDSHFFSATEDHLGGFWLSSNRGVFRLPTETMNTIQPGQTLTGDIIQIGKSDGMPRSETNGGFQPAVWRDDRGRLWYPTTGGAAMIDPAAAAREAPPAPAMLRVLSDSRLVDLSVPVSLPPLPELLEFSFASPTYQRADQLEYQYRLVNYDEHWLTTQSGNTIYRRLPAGDFRFEVRARRPAGPYSGATGLNLSVARHPFYNPWLWGAGVMVLLTGVVLILLAIHRRRELRREQVLQAQKMESIGMLAGGVAHDFNNILTAIMQSTEMMADALPSDSPMQRDATRILDSAERAAGLTRQLLTFARRQPVQPRWIDLRTEISSMREFIERLLPARIRITWELDDCGRCFIDPVQLQQVLINLIVNAREAIADKGSIQVRLERVDAGRNNRRNNHRNNRRNKHDGRQVTPNPPPTDVASLSVRDDGPGMDPRVKARVFEPFFTTRRESGGSGLGLAVSHSIIHQAGGLIELESSPGRGTCFVIRLPVDLGRPDSGEASAGHRQAE